MSNRVETPPPFDGLPQASRRPDSIRMILFVWVPAAIFFTAVVTSFTGFAFTAMGLVVGPMLSVFAASSIYHVLSVARERRGMTILTYLETAVRLNLPLDSYLRAAELSESGTTADRLAALRGLLEQGIPIGVALSAAVSDIPPRVTAAIAAAEPMGQLQITLTRLIQNDARPPEPGADRLPFYRFYPLIIGTLVIMLVNGFAIFVAPKFHEIFKDFKVDLPPSTVFLFKVNYFLMEETPISLILLLVLPAAVFIVIAWFLSRAFAPASGFRDRPFLRDLLAWYTPFSHRLSSDRALADVCQLLADSSRAAIPLPTALLQASTLHVNRHARDQIVRWHEALLAGQLPADAAAAAGMPPLLSGLLTPAQSSRAANPENSANVFDFLARYYRARFSRLLILLQAAYEPAALLALGLLVGFVVYSLFSPLVTLIQGVTGYYPETFL